MFAKQPPAKPASASLVEENKRLEIQLRSLRGLNARLKLPAPPAATAKVKSYGSSPTTPQPRPLPAVLKPVARGAVTTTTAARQMLAQSLDKIASSPNAAPPASSSGANSGSSYSAAQAAHDAMLAAEAEAFCAAVLQWRGGAPAATAAASSIPGSSRGSSEQESVASSVDGCGGPAVDDRRACYACYRVFRMPALGWGGGNGGSRQRYCSDGCWATVEHTPT